MQQPVNQKGTTAAKFNRLMNLLIPPKDVLSTRENEIAKFILPTALI